MTRFLMWLTNPGWSITFGMIYWNGIPVLPLLNMRFFVPPPGARKGLFIRDE